MGGRVLEPDLTRLHLFVEMRHLGENLRVLRRDAVGSVEAADEVVEAGRAEQHLEGVALSAGRVERHEPGREGPPCATQALFRDLQLRLVRLQLGSDPVQLHRCQVVCLDHALEVRVELLDLAHHALGFGLLRRDRGIADCRRRHQNGREAQGYDCRRRTSNRAANRSGRWARSAPQVGPVRHKLGTLATRPDARNQVSKP